MKVLLFTHKSDIDGMGNVVLAKLAFEKVSFVLCETFNLEQEIEKYYETGEIYDYDMIFVTDLCIEEPMLSKVANDLRLKNKILVFDHHKSSLESNNYSFINISIEDEKGLCCGTSLFYEYLVKQGLIDKSWTALSQFVELTRRYDTWEWKTKFNDENARYLTLLFDSVGCEGYISLMYKKLNNSSLKDFEFDDLEKLLIKNKIEQVNERLDFYIKKMKIIDYMDLKAGVVFIDYQYRNDIAEFLRQNNYDIDFVMLIAMDHFTISYRSIKPGVNVRIIAEAMGGKGHDKASSSPINPYQIEKINEILLKCK